MAKGRKTSYYKWVNGGKKSNGTTKEPKKTYLANYDLKSFADESTIRAEFSHLKESTVEWIIDRRFELISKANKYEHMLVASLGGHNIEFVHQAPFYIGGRIYFVYFYIPRKRIAIEVDGVYHNSPDRYEKDRVRDFDLKSIGIRTIRLSNPVVQSKSALKTQLQLFGIVTPGGNRKKKINCEAKTDIESIPVDPEIELTSNTTHKSL